MFRDQLRKGRDLLVQVLTSRKQFKLLLQVTTEHLNLRLQALASVMDLFSTVVRPVPITAPFGESILVVAPHQDDEAIGCGGALALQAMSGRSATVVILHDGADEYRDVSMTRAELQQLRNGESRDAAREVGVDAPIFLGLKDLRSTVNDTASALRRIVDERGVDAVFTPFVLDGHPDHRAANFSVARALAGLNRPVRTFQYEVWSHCIPNVLVIIDRVAEKKDRMLACFAYANRAHDYAHATKGLNMFHSRLLRAGEARYVECFFELPREEFVRLVDRVEQAESGNL